MTCMLALAVAGLPEVLLPAGAISAKKQLPPAHRAQVKISMQLWAMPSAVAEQWYEAAHFWMSYCCHEATTGACHHGN